MGELLRLAESDFSKVLKDMENVANMTKIGSFLGGILWKMYLGESFDTFGVWASPPFLFELFYLCIYIQGDQGDCFLGRYSRL